MSETLKFWIGFNLVKGIGAVRMEALLAYFGDVRRAWQAAPADLVEAGLSPKLAERIAIVRKDVNLDQVIATMEAQGIQALTWDDPEYPSRLKQVDQPPPVLYLRGSLAEEDDWAVAIVGTRRVTPYGRQVSEELATFLAHNGITVVSGLARGVDTVAHWAALRAGGRTLAVLGSGVDRIYPPEHTQLAEKMMAQGALISDYAPGTPPDSSNFPPRNRIISGLSQAVVVVEAGETSGALITASFAAEQGREVFAIPGNILAPQSKGTNRLIQQGARPLLDAREILDVLDINRANAQRVARQTLPVDPVEASVYQVLGNEPVHVDEIRSLTGLPIEKVSAALTMMELKGTVRQIGAMNYIAVHDLQADYLVAE